MPFFADFVFSVTVITTATPVQNFVVNVMMPLVIMIVLPMAQKYAFVDGMATIVIVPFANQVATQITEAAADLVNASKLLTFFLK